MSEPVSVLLIEDNPGDARLIELMLQEDPGVGFQLARAERLSRGLEILAGAGAGVILLDLSLPDSHGLATFEAVFAHSPKVPIIVLSGNDDKALALGAVKGGAQDYLVKGKIDHELLTRSIQYAIERKRYQDELEHQANYDALTGLPNRQLLHDRLRQAVFAQRNLRSIAVVFLDLDHFKVINDSLGHNFGDEVLRTVGQRLEASVREGDTVARLGGDEFVLILNDQSRHETLFRTLRRVLARVSEPMRVGEREIHVTCSAGVSIHPQDGPDVQTLLKNADAAMYGAKSRGRNGFEFFTSEMNLLANERLSMEQDLRRAVDRGELTLHYQPRVDLRSGRIRGVEALVRWDHPVRGLLYPDRFIPLAEETGLIVPMGEWILEQACRQATSWRARGLNPIVMAVNLSARQLRDKGLVGAIRDVCARYPQAAQHLELELTESMVMHDAEAAIDSLSALKQLGVSLSIDDFGTGYSSLSYLRRLPLDALKIDGSFVRDIVDGREDDGGLFVSAIISLAHGLRLKVIAEGVESEVQRSFLVAHQCDEMQGFLFSRALPAGEVEGLLKADRELPAASRKTVGRVV